MENTDKAVDYVIYLDSFALSLKVEGLRPHTISCYVRDARRLGELTGWVTPSKLTSGHVRSYIDWLSERVAPPTVTSAQLGLRRFFRFLVDEQDIASDPSAKIKLVRFRVAPQPTYSPCNVKSVPADFSSTKACLASWARAGACGRPIPLATNAARTDNTTCQNDLPVAWNPMALVSLWGCQSLQFARSLQFDRQVIPVASRPRCCRFNWEQTAIVPGGCRIPFAVPFAHSW